MSTTAAHPAAHRPTLAWPLAAAGVLLLAVMLAVAAARLAGPPVAEAPAVAVLATLDCRFDDRDDGAVLVREAQGGAVLHVVAPGSQGFLRGTLRALVRERRQRGLGAEQPFRLQALADGSLTLNDPATGRRVDLAAFGPTNAAVFARLLAGAPAR